MKNLVQAWRLLSSSEKRPLSHYPWPFHHRWVGYVVALFAVVLATILRRMLIPITGAGAPYVMFFGAVLSIAYAYGFGPGIVTAVVSGLTAPFTVTNYSQFLPSQLACQALMFIGESIWVVVTTNAFVVHKQMGERNMQALTASREVLRQSEELYRVLTEVSPQVTWEATSHGEITYINQWWEALTGLSRTDSLGYGWVQALPHDDREAFVEKLSAMMAGTATIEVEVTLIRGIDGQKRIHLMRGQPVLSKTGQIVKWVGVATDIHEQKATLAQLATAVSARDNFLSMASHELKTPLTSMQLMTQMMRRNHVRGRQDAFEPSKVQRLIAQTDKSVQRLTRIIDDMLDVSRIARGRMAFRFEAFDLKELAHDVIERMQDQLDASSTKVRLICHGSLVGTWDRFRIEQVLTNLLTNAIRYGQGSPIEVSVATDTDGQASLSVRDFGPGIALADRERIFEQFERASTQQALGGLGLGLFICREIVERHGGTIALAQRPARPGGGAEFVVSLPMTAQAARTPSLLSRNLQNQLS